jgi:hypothetical protein
MSQELNDCITLWIYIYIYGASLSETLGRGGYVDAHGLTAKGGMRGKP